MSDGYDPADRLAQLRRYAATHNPASSPWKGAADKLNPIKNRHVSIPGVRVDSPDDEKGQLCIGGPLNLRDKPVFSSGSAWRDRTSEMDRLPHRRMAAAGIVKMYISSHDMIGPVKCPLYTSLSDGRGHSEPLDEGETLIGQSLLKKKVKRSEEYSSLELPSIAITQTAAERSHKTKLTEINSEELDLTLTNTSRTEKLMDTRVS